MKSSRVLAIVFLFCASSAHALIGEVPTIKAMAAIPTDNPSIEVVALLGETPTAVDQLILRAFNRADGSFIEQQPLVPYIDDTKELVDVVFGFGTLSVLVSNGQVLQYPVAFDASGFPKLIGDTPTILGPFGNSVTDGTSNTIAAAPGGIIAIGTESGRLHIVSPRDPGIVTIDLGPGPITGLGTIAQVGAFAFVAVHNGHVVGVNASSGALLFDLADPRPDPLIELSTGAVFEPNDEPLTNPIPVPIVTANGTKEVTTLLIPANPTIGGVLGTGLVVIAAAPIVEVDVGSLFLLEEEGAVLYDAGNGETFTIAGAVADLAPDTLKLSSKGRFVTAMIECEDNLAGRINGKTVSLEYGSFAVGPLAAAIGDADGDGQVDLLAKFDRAEVAGMLHGVATGDVNLVLRWRFDNGTDGSDTVTVRIVH